MRAVNLLPRDEQRARIEGARTPFLIAAGGVVFVTVVAALLSFSAAGSVDDQKAELADVESAIANLPKAPQSEVSQGTLIRERADRTNALAAALTTRVAFDSVLSEVAYVFPKDAWLTNFEASAPEVQTAPAGGAPPPPPAGAQALAAGVTIQGAAFKHETVATVLARLALVPSLENVQLTASTLVEPQAEARPSGSQAQAAAPGKPEKPFVTFIVTASLRTGAGR
jgi:Tfp pilus assembly protein PilN